MSDEQKKTKKAKFKIKDEHFNKIKSSVTPSGTIKETPADWRKIVIGGNRFTFKKGQVLTKEEAGHFNADSKKYWLTNA